MSGESEIFPGCAVWIIAFAVFVGIVCFSKGVVSGKNSIRTEAVEHGAARWVAAPDGSTTFEWIEQEVPRGE